MVGEADAPRIAAEIALADWLTRCRDGHGESWADLLRAHPELAPELQRLSQSGASLVSLAPGAEGWDKLLKGESSLGEQRRRLSEGVRVGRYALQDRLGAGGMGVVWRAVDMELGDEVALKFLPEVLAGDPAAMRYLKDEAKVLLGLTHPNIVRVRNLETSDDIAYLIEEYLEGGTLDQLVAARVQAGERGLSNAEALHVLREIAGALDMAHAQGVTHRDIKPANLLADRRCHGERGLADARIKVTDFGLAFVATRSIRARTSFRPSGTLPYMAPEVLLGGQPSPKTDVYSLGATLFHLVAGHAPFEGDNIPFQILHIDAPPANTGDSGLDRAIAAALQKDPAFRPHSLARLLEIAESGAGGRSRRAVRWSFAAVVLLAIFGSGAWSLRGSPDATSTVVAMDANTRSASDDEPHEVERALSPRIELEPEYRRARWVVRDVLSLRGRVFHPRERFVIVRVGNREGLHRLDAEDRFEIEEALPLGRSTPELSAAGADTSIRLEVLRDDEAPKIAAIEPDVDVSTTFAASIDLCVRVDDQSAVTVRLDGNREFEPRDDGTWRVRGVELAEGETRVLTVVARDEAAHEATLMLHVTRANAPPQLLRAEPALGATIQHAPTVPLAFEFDEPLRFARFGNVELELDASGRRATGVAEPDRYFGTWTRELIVQDRAGTNARFSVEHEVIVAARPIDGFETLDDTPGWAALPVRIRDPKSGVIFRLIPPGEFEMGAREDEAEFDDAPRHVVRITRPFYLAETEVSIEQFERFVEATHHRTSAESSRNAITRAPQLEPAWRLDPNADWRPLDRTANPRTVERPVSLVSWRDARAYCASFGYRLPSEAEWEYACRAGSHLRYPWGQRAELAADFANLADLSHARVFELDSARGSNDDGAAFAAPIASFAPNSWGLHDMLGNVWEWCEDVYAPEAYVERAAVAPCEDPLLASERDDQPRVLRGGGFTSTAVDVSCAQRAFDFPDQPSDLYGFRPVWVP